MSEKEPSEASTSFMIASIEEAHSYLRDTSKRMTDHVQFYLTFATALLAGFFLILNSQVNPALLPPSIALLSLTLSGIGFITFARLSSIKVQATTYFARAIRWNQYFLDKDHDLVQYFAGEDMLQEEAIRMRIFPFSREITFLLRAFALFNSLVMTLSLLFAAVTVLPFFGIVPLQSSTPYIVSYSVLTLAVLGATFALANSYLMSQVSRARADFLRILGTNRVAKSDPGSNSKSTV